GQSAFRILARDFDIDDAEAARLGSRAHPAEDAGYDKTLPGFQLDALVVLRPDAANMREVLHDIADPVGGLGIEVVWGGATGEAFQILQVALAGEADPLAGGQLAVHDALGILQAARYVGIAARQSRHQSITRWLSPATRKTALPPSGYRAARRRRARPGRSRELPESSAPDVDSPCDFPFHPVAISSQPPVAPADRSPMAMRVRLA